jgi:pyrroloquinoline quinone biosynthesis protein B
MMVLSGCIQSSVQDQTEKTSEVVPLTSPSLVILGTVQDAGSPHIGCEKACCSALVANPDPSRMVVSLGIIDPEYEKTFLIDATPDITKQLRMLRSFTSFKTDDVIDGIFLTHAHMGHYAGLLYLGREALGAQGVKVYAMPRMKSFLETNGPWSQLVELENITLHPIHADNPVVLSSSITITPFRVPHRDEYSETVGYVIEGPEKKALFIPDIDKWDKWERSIVDEIAEVDYAFLDATFFDGAEINNRDIKEIPHPFVIESMELFKNLPPEEKSKIHFIHFNHTNPLLIPDSEQAEKVREAGYGIAMTGSIFRL